MVTGCNHQETGQVPEHWNYPGGHPLLRTYYVWGSEQKCSWPHHEPSWAGSTAVPILQKTLQRG